MTGNTPVAVYCLPPEYTKRLYAHYKAPERNGSSEMWWLLWHHVVAAVCHHQVPYPFQITQCFAPTSVTKHRDTKEMPPTIKIYSIKNQYFLLLIFTMALVWHDIPFQINPSTFAKSMIFKTLKEKYLFIPDICHLNSSLCFKLECTPRIFTCDFYRSFLCTERDVILKSWVLCYKTFL